MIFERIIIVIIAHNLLSKDIFQANISLLKGILSCVYRNYLCAITIIYHKMHKHSSDNTFPKEALFQPLREEEEKEEETSKSSLQLSAVGT